MDAKLNQRFDWIPFYEELADSLLLWRNRQSELIAFLEELRRQNLVITPISDQDNTEISFLLTEIDPFTFFAVFNRSIKIQARIAILKKIKVKFKLNSDVPINFDGIPLVNNFNSWFIAYKKDRNPQDVILLWNVFSDALKRSPLTSSAFEKSFNMALTVKYTSTKLTLGLFWIRPRIFLNLDKNIVQFLNIKIPSKFSFNIYLSIINKVMSEYSDFAELSNYAYLAVKSNPKTLDSKTGNELDAKYLLAKEYVNKGNIEGATELINEIIKKGNVRHSELADILLKDIEKIAGKAKDEKSTKNDIASMIANSNLIASRAESVAVKDVLGRDKITQALYRLLTEREDVHPFAIGLFGHWGAGKSSQINFLKVELDKSKSPKVLLADFNAWYNEKASNISAMIAQSVVDSLVQEMGFWDRFKLATQLAIRRNRNFKKIIKNDLGIFKIKYFGLLLFAPQIFIGLPVFVYLYCITYQNVLALTITITISLVTVFITIKQFLNFVPENLTDWFKTLNVKNVLTKFRLPDYTAQKGLSLEIHRTLQDICELCLGSGRQPNEGKHLLLVVDDLDRCSVNTVKEVLDAVRLVAHIPRVVTLVAIDERMAFAAVEKHYQEFGHAGREPALVARDYLAKVLQVSVTLPIVDSNSVARFIDDVMFKDVNTSSHIQENLTSVNEIGSTAVDSEFIIENELESNDDSIEEVDKIDQDLELIKPSQTALLEEKLLFKELALNFGFTNPRLVWRLYMAWKLFKSMLFDSYKIEDVDVPMCALFWQEWLHQLEREQSDFFLKWIKNRDIRGKPENMPIGIYEAVNHKLRSEWEKNSHFANLADAVLLPSSFKR